MLKRLFKYILHKQPLTFSRSVTRRLSTPQKLVDSNMDSRFANLDPAPVMEIQTLRDLLAKDHSEKKLDLGVGAYRTDEGLPWVLPVVRAVEQRMVADADQNHEYLNFLGMDAFSSAAAQLLLGADSAAIAEGRVASMQTVSSGGAVRIAAEFLRRILKCTTAYVSEPSWDNHTLMFRYAGFPEVRYYRYWDANARGVDFPGMMSDLQQAPENSVVVMQPIAHNPTGCDPTREQWKAIADVIEERKLFPFFDIAYQGFASGDLEEDAWVVRYFAGRGLELFCAQSFSKSMGLYCERVGALVAVLRSADLVASYRSHMVVLARTMYISPPGHGAKVALAILTDPDLNRQWRDCIEEMAQRVRSMRRGLRERLEKLGTPGSWSHITEQIGMFSFLGLSVPQVLHLREHYHIYTLRNSRTNMCGLTSRNLDYVAEAICETVRKLPA